MDSQPIRLLIHPRDKARYSAIAEALQTAVETYPENFDSIVDRPGTIDHVGYHNPTLSSVVFCAEPFSQYWRLTIRPELHPVFAELFALATN